MKKLLAIVFVASAMFLFSYFRPHYLKAGTDFRKADPIEIPENVKAVIDHSCYGCHNSTSRNAKAKAKVEFDKLDSLKTFIAIGVLQDIHNQVDSTKMPPKEFLKKYPDHALSGKDKEILLNWASESANKLAGK
jgi:hypothetical protein